MTSWQSIITSPTQFFKELRRNGNHLADTEIKLKTGKNETLGDVDRSEGVDTRSSDLREKNASFLVHSMVLSSRSHVMERQILDQKRRLTSRQSRFVLEVEGSSVTKDVLGDFLDILYFEEVEFNEMNVLGLVQCCKQFGLQGDLLDRCGDCLVQTLHLSNAVQYLELSLIYNLPPLKTECMKLIQCSKTLFQNPFLYKSISLDILSLIFTLDPLPCNEEELVDFVCVWKSVATPNVLPVKFDQLLELIRFPTLSTKYLTGPLFTSGLLSVEDQHLIMCDAVNSHGTGSRKSRYSSVPRGVTPLVWFESKEGRTFTIEFDSEDTFKDLLERFAKVSGLPMLGIDVLKVDERPFDQDKVDNTAASIGSLNIFRESRLTYRPRQFLNLENDSNTKISPTKTSLPASKRDLSPTTVSRRSAHAVPDQKSVQTLDSAQNYQETDTQMGLDRSPRSTSISPRVSPRQSRHDGLRSCDTSPAPPWPADWKNKMVSIKFKISARSLLGVKKDSTKMSKPKVVDNLQWIAETYCKDGEHIELFLYCGGEAHALNFLTHGNKDQEWKCLVHVAQFKVKNWQSGKSEMRRGWETTAEFTPRGKCKWGYTKFMKVSKIQENAKEYLNDHGQLQFEIDFVPERIQSWF